MGLMHVKSDSPLLYALSKEGWEDGGFSDSRGFAGCLFRPGPQGAPEICGCLNIRTYYEQRWLEEGKNIHYLRTQRMSPSASTHLATGVGDFEQDVHAVARLIPREG